MAEDNILKVRNDKRFAFKAKDPGQFESTVKRILRMRGYPPDKQEAATNTVLQQAELLSEFWTQVSAP